MSEETEYQQISEASRTMIDAEAEQTYESSIKFNPPAYIQRYLAVLDIIQDPIYQGQIRKVVDFGCSEFGFFNYLKNTPSIEEILFVDIDSDVLERYCRRLEPLYVDHLNARERPLIVNAYEGSIVQNDISLKDTDAVVCIEVIEHLHPEELLTFPFNIFGYIKPKVAIITTPNADFNVLFPNFSGFRHPDHKFEWTRQQFQDWAENIVLRYPDYKVTFHKICNGPDGTEHLGACSQMAVFHAKDDREPSQIDGVCGLFKLITSQNYPCAVDNRSDEQKILDEAVYYINQMSFYDEECHEQVPMEKILYLLQTKKFNISLETLRTVLEDGGWAIESNEKGPVILVPQERSDDDEFSDFSSLRADDDDMDPWDEEPGPPGDYSNRFVNETSSNVENWYSTNWDEEPNIVVPENNSILQESNSVHNGEQILHNSEPVSSGPWNESIEMEQYIHMDDRRELFGNQSMSFIIDQSDIRNLDFSTDSDIPSRFTKSIVLSSFPSSDQSEELNDSISDDRFLICPINDVSEDSYGSVTCDSIMFHPNIQDNSRISLKNAKSVDETLSFQPHVPLLHTSIDPVPYFYDSTYSNSLIDTDIIDFGIESSFDHGISHQTHSYMEETQNSSLISLQLSPKQKPLKEFLNLTNGSLKGSKHQSDCFVESCENNVFASNHCHLLKNESKKIQEDVVSISSLNSIESPPKFTSSPKLNVKAQNQRTKSSLFAHDPPTELHENVQNGSVESDICNISSTLNSSCSTVHENLPSKNQLKSLDLNVLEDDTINKFHYQSQLESDEIIDKKQLSEKMLYTDRIKHLNAESIPVSRSLENIPVTSRSITNDVTITRSDSSGTLEECVKQTQNFSIRKPCSFRNEEINLQTVENNIRAFSPEISDTPSHSWSPEIMDSGYPNSAFVSAQDTTPEYDLSSIVQDHISDSESPSIAEAPHFGLLPELIQVANGDLVNNNCDDEGNNMVAVEINDQEDIQPFIDVLENDLENENDIYVLQNGFPAWLLRIMDMPNPLNLEERRAMFEERDRVINLQFNEPDEEDNDALVDNDEGFDSSSLEESNSGENINDPNKSADPSNSDSEYDEAIDYMDVNPGKHYP